MIKNKQITCFSTKVELINPEFLSVPYKINKSRSILCLVTSSFQKSMTEVFFPFSCLSEVTVLHTYFYMNAASSIIIYQCMHIIIWHLVIPYKRYYSLKGVCIRTQHIPYNQTQSEFIWCIIFTGSGTVFFLILFLAHFVHITL